MTSSLTPRQQKLYDALVGRGDVLILDLFEAVAGKAAEDVRDAQQYLGPVISGTNKRLETRSLRISPGQMKQTYTLIVVK